MLPALGVVVVGHASSSRAHVADVTEAAHAMTVVEVFVDESEIRVELETGVPDLIAFESVFPDEFRVRMGLESEPLEPRLRRFFSEELVIRAGDGPPLLGRVVSFETRRRVPLDEIGDGPEPGTAPGGPPVVFMVLGYDLAGRPETLALEPPQAGGAGPAANIGLAAYHLGLPVTEFRPFDAEEILDLDWEHPGLSSFRNRDPARPHPTPLNVFLHVEPFEVRVEVIARPVDLQSSFDLGVGGMAVIAVAIQEDVAQRAAACLAEVFDLTIDGETVRPDLERAGFVDRSLLGTAAADPPGDLDSLAAALGVVFRRAVPAYPGEVTVTWKLFSDTVNRVTGAVTDDGGALRVSLHGGDNVLCWTNVLRNAAPPSPVAIERPPSPITKIVMWASWLGLAVMGMLLIRGGARAAGGSGSWSRVVVVALIVAGLGAGSRFATRLVHLSDARAQAIATALLHNVYRAFDGRPEDATRDALEGSATADPAAEIYRETRRRLGLEGRSGGPARVDAVDVLEVRTEGTEPGFTARCTWEVGVVASHWGHLHRRTDSFVADLVVEPVDGRWMISGMERRR
jgi:hypothetical protein